MNTSAGRAALAMQVELAGGAAFVSDADFEAVLDEPRATSATTEPALAASADARLAGLRSALGVLAVLALLALFLAQAIPTRIDERKE